MTTKTLAQLVVDLGVPFKDNLEGTTSSDSATRNQFIAAGLAGNRNDAWKGSEVLFLDTTGMTGNNPKKVTGFNAATGTFTMNEDWNTSIGVPTGVRFVLVRLRGQGVPFTLRKRAIQRAIEDMADAGAVTSLNLGAVVAGQYRYTIASGLDTVFEVVLRSPASSSAFYQVQIPPAQWWLEPGRVLGLRTNKIGRMSADLIVTGRYYPTFSDALTTTYNLSADSVIKEAAEWLTLFSTQPGEQSAHNALMGDRLRSYQEYWYPSEQRII